MRTAWQEDNQNKSVTAPLSLIITGFSPVQDVRKTLTPELRKDQGITRLLVDLGAGANRLGGSILAQVYNELGDKAPDVDNPEHLKDFFGCMQVLNERGEILAYHDRSDGGLFATLAEMAFAGRSGLSIELDSLEGDSLSILFNEELGAVIQVKNESAESILAEFDSLV